VVVGGVDVPTVLRLGPYRFFFYSSDGAEPPHVHVEHDEKTCKFWLEHCVSSATGAFARKSSIGFDV
jgi:hypothetical protein